MTKEELKALPADPAEIVVETVDPAIEQPEQKTAADDAAEAFKKQLEEVTAREKAAKETAESERQLRLAAEQRERERTQEATRYRSDMQSTELQRVGELIESADRQREMAVREHARALEAGEWEKASNALSVMTEASSNKTLLMRDKAILSSRLPDPVQGRVETAQPDPVEMMISSATPATQQFLRQHRELIVRDHNGRPVLDNKVLAAHYQAAADGIRADTPEYFQFIESRLKPESGDSGDTASPSPPPQRRTAPVAAPVSREAINMNGKPTTQRIQLTKDEVEAAHMFGDPKKTQREREIDYWNSKKALETEGKLGVRH